MEIKSKAQLRRLTELADKGKITKTILERWIAQTPEIHKLPEKLNEKTQLKKVKSI